MPHLLIAGKIHRAGLALLEGVAGFSYDYVEEVSEPSYLPLIGKADALVIRTQPLTAAAIVQRLADHGYEGWFVVEAEQDPKANPPLEMAKKGHKELLRVMALAGYEVTR